MKEFSKGAEWRKWDLHVHTPKSICQHFGVDDNATWEKYISELEALSSDFAVLGINDYFFIDGYTKLIDEQQNNGRLQNLKLFPVVEFRIEKFAGIDFKGLKRINLHVIFSDEIPVDVIKSQFLNTLEQSYYLEKGGEPWNRAITRESVEELGAGIKKGVPTDQLSQYGSDLTEGFNNLNLKEEQIFDSLKKSCFTNKYLIAVGKTEWSDLKWTDSAIATKKSIINKAHIVFTAAESVKKFYSAKQQLENQNVNSFLLDCSDAHYCVDSAEKDRVGNCFTWIKADPTFDGLRQILNEPEERVFIGEKPDLFDRVAINRTKYIKEIKISPVSGYLGQHGKWFDNISIPFNKELVAIIGNKGSGKSAVADIVALCANYNGDDFSFLTGRKFRIRNGQVAKNFEATLVWHSDERKPLNLNGSSDPAAVIEVKYIPQGQFEKLTNEIEDAKKFQKEIESVVFSHIDDAEKYGAINFTELVESKKKTVNTDLKALFEKIDTLNSEIINLEFKTTEVYKQKLNSELAKKNEELFALIEPTLVSDPNEDPIKKKANETALAEIDQLKRHIEGLELTVDNNNKTHAQLLQDLKFLKETRQEVLAKFNEFDFFKNRIGDSVAKYDLDVDELFSVKFNLDPLDCVISTKQAQLNQVKQRLGKTPKIDDSESLPDHILSKKVELKEMQSKLDSDQQAYQEYLNAKIIWQNERNKIIGESTSVGTVNYYKKELEYIEKELISELSDKYAARKLVVRDIYRKRYEIVVVYKSAKKSLTLVIDANADILGDYKIDVDAAMVSASTFKGDFLHFINQTKAGTFRSKEGADKEFEDLVTDVNFDNENEVIYLLDCLIAALNNDCRDGKKLHERVLSDQVNDLSGLYEYLFKLKFLDYNYQLKQGDKKLEQLSPGERGALLLVFYLLLDKNDIPLIIDQPEDNLDNNSVAKILVPFIRKAKKRRQIIIVTHNPNLAVVSDAEQVIHVSLNKDDNNTFSTISGSIENPKVNEKIVNVLEGAMPAFNVRKSKYYG